MSLIPFAGAVQKFNRARDYRIERSLRFNSADSAYLNRTPASAGNRRTWTLSFWVKRSTLGAEQRILFSNDNGLAHATVEFTSGDALAFADYTDPSPTYELTTTQLFRDVSAWYHIVAVFDTTNGTSGNRMRLYVNGTRITAFSASNYPTQNFDGYTNNNVPHGIGARIASPVGQYFNGYLTEMHMVDGQALEPSSFGEFNSDTGVWQPKKYTGTYGTNGFYLNFSDNSGTTSTTLGKDRAGSNNWTPNNFSVTAGAGNDSLVDSPTRYGTDTGAGGEVRGNYATLNPIDPAIGSGTISNGNLNFSCTSGGEGRGFATIRPSAGKYYCEFEVTDASRFAILIENGTRESGYDGQSANSVVVYYSRNAYSNDTNFNNYLASPDMTNGDIIQVALDLTNQAVWIGKNNTWGNSATSSEIASGNTTNSLTAFISSTTPVQGNVGVAISDPSGSGSAAGVANFGQRPFSYTAPSGFKALVTTNLL